MPDVDYYTTNTYQMRSIVAPCAKCGSQPSIEQIVADGRVMFSVVPSCGCAVKHGPFCRITAAIYMWNRDQLQAAGSRAEQIGQDMCRCARESVRRLIAVEPDAFDGN